MSDKKQIIVTCALQLFMSKGIHAVGVNEIIATAGVAKKTLYHHFKSKEAVIIAALEYRDLLFMNWLESHMQQSCAKQALQAIFEALDQWFSDQALVLGAFRGCFFINASVEYKERTHPINQQCVQHKQKVFERIHKEVLKINPDPVQAELLAKTLCLLKEGAITTALVQGNRKAAREIVPLVTALIDQTANKA